MKKLKRKLKRALTPYHIATTICLIVLITSLCIILKPETKKTPSGITVVSSKTKENEEITEEEAKELAIKQFKKIGEKNLEKDKINIIHKNITDNKEEIQISFNTSYVNKSQFINLLKEHRRVDIIRGVTSKGISKPNHEPEPKISLKEPIRKSARVNPSPIPRASIIEGRSLFFDANISARPSMIQFTVIRERNVPRLSYKLGINPWRRNSTIVTNPAIITI